MFGSLDIIAYLGIQDVNFSKKLAAADVQASATAKTINRALTGALIAGAAAFVSASLQSAKFEKKMQEVASLLGGEGAYKMSEYNSRLLEMSNNIPLDLTKDFAAGLYQIVSATVPLNQQMGVLEVTSKAAIAGVAGLSDTFNMGSSIVKSYGLSFDQMGYVMDIVFQTVKQGQTTLPELASAIGDVVPIAASMGVKLEEVSGAMAAMAGVTGSTSEAATQLKGMMVALLKPTESLKYAYKKLGVASGKELIEKAHGLQNALLLLKKYTEKYNIGIGELIGRRQALVGFYSVTGALADDYAKKTKLMYDAVGSASEAYDIQMLSLSNQAKLLGNIFQSALISSGDKYNSILKAGTGFLVSHAHALQMTVKVMIDMAVQLGAIAALYKLYQLRVKAAALANKIFRTSTGLIGLAITAVVAGISIYVNNLREQEQKQRDAITTTSDQVQEFGHLIDKLNRLNAVQDKTTYQTELQKTTHEKLNKMLKEVGINLDDYNGELDTLKERYRAIRLEQLIQQKEELNKKIETEIGNVKHLNTTTWDWVKSAIGFGVQAGVLTGTVAKSSDGFTKLKDKLALTNKEIEELGSTESDLKDAGIQTNAEIKAQITNLENLRKKVSPNSVAYKELTDKIFKLEVKLGASTAELEKAADKQYLFKDASIATEKAVGKQIDKLESLERYLGNDSLATAGLTVKLFNLYKQMGDYAAIEGLAARTDDLKAKTALLSAAGIASSTALQNQISTYEALEPAVQGDALATANLETNIYNLLTKLGDKQKLTDFIAGIDDLAGKQVILKAAGIETTGAIQGQLDTFNALIPAVQGDDLAIKNLLEKVKPLYDKIGDVKGWDDFVARLGISKEKADELMGKTKELTDKQQLLKQATESLKDPNQDLIDKYQGLIDSGKLTSGELETVKAAMEKLQGKTENLGEETQKLGDNFKSIGSFVIQTGHKFGVLDDNLANIGQSMIGVLTGGVSPLQLGLTFLGTAFSMLSGSSEPVVRSMEEVRESLGLLDGQIQHTSDVLDNLGTILGLEGDYSNELADIFKTNLVDRLQNSINSYLEQLQTATGDQRALLEQMVADAQEQLANYTAAFDISQEFDVLQQAIPQIISSMRSFSRYFGDQDLSVFNDALQETISRMQLLFQQLDPTSQAFEDLFDTFMTGIDNLNVDSFMGLSGDLANISAQALQVGIAFQNMDVGTDVWQQAREELVQLYAQMVSLGADINFDALQQNFGITRDEIMLLVTQMDNAANSGNSIGAAFSELAEHLVPLSDNSDVAIDKFNDLSNTTNSTKEAFHKLAGHLVSLVDNSDVAINKFNDLSNAVQNTSDSAEVLSNSFNAVFDPLKNATEQAAQMQEYFGNADFSETTAQLESLTRSSIDMLASLDPNSQAFADMSDQIYNAIQQVISMGGNVQGLIAYLDSAGYSVNDLLDSFSNFSDSSQSINKAMQTAGDGVNDLVHNLHEIVPAIEEVQNIESPFHNLNDDAVSAKDNIKALLPEIQAAISDLQDQQDAIDVQLAIDLEPLQQEADTAAQHLQDLMNQREQVQIQIDVQVQEATDQFNEFKDNYHNIINQLEGEDVDFYQVSNALEELTGQSQALEIQWSDMLGTIFEDYSQFGDDVKAAQDAISQMMYFGEVDEGAMQQINAAIFEMQDYLATLNPDSQAYQDAQQSLNDLISQYQELGGQLDEEAAIQFNTEQAQQALSETQDQYNQTVQEIQDQALPINADIEQAQAQLDAINQQMTDLQNQAAEQQLEIQAQIDQAQAQLETLLAQITAVQTQVQTPTPLNLDPLPALNNLEQVRSRYNEVNQEMANTFHPNLDDSIAIQKIDNIKQKYEIQKAVIESGIQVSINDSSAISALDEIGQNAALVQTDISGIANIDTSIDVTSALADIGEMSSAIDSTASQISDMTSMQMDLMNAQAAISDMGQIQSATQATISTINSISKIVVLPKTKSGLESINEIKQKTGELKTDINSIKDTNFHIGITDAMNQLQRMTNKINNIPRNLDINLNYNEHGNPPSAYRQGGYIPQAKTGAIFGNLPKFADGGVLAVLHPPEVVIRPEVTKQYSPVQWQAFNRTGNPNAFGKQNNNVNIIIENPGKDTSVLVDGERFNIDNDIYERTRYINRRMTKTNPYKGY